MNSTGYRKILSAPNTEKSDALGTIIRIVDILHGFDLNKLAHTRFPQAFMIGMACLCKHQAGHP